MAHGDPPWRSLDHARMPWWNSGSIRFASLTVLDWACVIVVAGCVQTMIIRFETNHGGVAVEASRSLMSPQQALHDPVFQAYLRIILGSLAAGGIVLGVLHWGLKKNLGRSGAPYRSWLVLAPSGSL